MCDDIKLYVSVLGSDNNDGTKEAPFATPAKAISAVRSIIAEGLCAPVTVYFYAGEYKADRLEFTANDSGTAQYPITYKAYGDGEVIFNNGVTIDGSKFKKVSGDARNKLQNCAKDNALVCNLGECGIKKDEAGGLYAEGTNAAVAPVDESFTDNNCEIFWNGKRMTLARYPNEGFLEIEDVCDNDADENTRLHKQTYPRGCTVIVDKDTNERVKTWANPQKAWMHGYFYWDWADSSTPVIKTDSELGRIYMKYSSGYGIRKGGTYYFYNVLEELDAPGEYYLDKDNLLLYVYPYSSAEEASVMVSLSRNAIITATGAENITFDGITFKGARSDAILLNGCTDCSILNCKIINVYGWAIRLSGYRNKVYGCDISHTGKGGISMSGGNRETLTPANNVAENNYIHDWSEVFFTYNSGIELLGCGNIASHNEFENTPHMAIYYNGNDHLMEYNYLHNVVQQSHDAGAIYGGRDWAAYGCVIRYNIIENAGNDKFTPCGIYWDDAQSGQTAYGNIIKNATGKSFLIGGGRDNVVENNMMIISEYPMLFDDRAREGVIMDGWYSGGRKDAGNWTILRQSPIKSEIWAKRFPTLAKLNDNFDDYDDPDLAINPSRASVKNNVCVCYNDYGFFVADSVKKFGVVENNLVFKSEDECFEDCSKYELKPEVKRMLPEFKDIPVNEIGRYKK